MAGQKGRDVLIKIADGAGGYETLAGIRTTRFSCVAGQVDGTNADSPAAWRELIDGAGVRSVAVQGNGVFKSAASDGQLRSLFFDGRSDLFQLVIPGFGVLQGRFQVTSLTYGGAFDGEAQFGLGLESAGAVSFAPLMP